MPWCPAFRSEYREGFHKCVDCGAWLVEHLPEEEKDEPIQMEYHLLIHLASGEDARQIRSILEEEGIASDLIRGIGSPKKQPGYASFPDHFAIYVPEAQLLEAKNIVEALPFDEEGRLIYVDDDPIELSAEEEIDLEDFEFDYKQEKAQFLNQMKRLGIAAACALALFAIWMIWR